MTKLDALRKLLAQPRDHHHMGKIGQRVVYAKSDGREKVSHVFRVLRSITRRSA